MLKLRDVSVFAAGNVARMVVMVRNASFEALDREHRASFHRHIVQTLADHLVTPIRDAAPDTLSTRMAAWHDRGLGHGISRRVALRKYLALHLTILPDFDVHPPVAAFFALPDMNGEQKIEMFYTRLKAS